MRLSRRSQATSGVPIQISPLTMESALAPTADKPFRCTGTGTPGRRADVGAIAACPARTDSDHRMKNWQHVLWADLGLAFLRRGM